jgi:hypothetical protein
MYARSPRRTRPLQSIQARRAGVNSILNMKVFLLAAAGSGNLANEHSLDLLIS